MKVSASLSFLPLSKQETMQDPTRPTAIPVRAVCAMPSDHPDDVVHFLVASHQAGHDCVLAILTDIIEGASRPLGTIMAIRDDGHYVGMVSGGCVEASVVSEACTAMTEKRDRICRYGKGSPWFDIVLPCRGGIGLHLHVLRDLTAPIGFLERRQSRQAVMLHYDSTGETLRTETGAAPTGWQGTVFTTGYRPDPQIMIFGGGIESHFLTALATAAGLTIMEGDVTRIMHHAQDQDTALVLLHHDLDRELPLLQAALQTEAFFIGCLGSRRTQARRLAALRAIGHDDSSLERIRGPIGLFGPSREARSVAVSVLAEIFSLIEARKAAPRT